MPKLIVNPNAASRREIPLSSSTMLTIGRDPTNDVVLPDSMVSRRHAIVEQRAGEYYLRDCSSANGSLVNGARVSECELRDGDVVAIGGMRLLFREEPWQSASGKILTHPSALPLRCPACREDYRRGEVFCRECGTQVAPRPESPPAAICPDCGSAVTLPARFCACCGSSLTSDGSRLEAPVGYERAGTGRQAVTPGSGTQSPPVASGSMAIAAEPQPVPDLPPRARPRIRERRDAAPREVPRVAARPGRRLAAALLDAVVVGSGEAMMLAPIAWYWWTTPVPRTPADVRFLPVFATVALLPLALAAGAAYHAYFWALKGATPGKELLGLRVETEDGRSPIGFERSLLRILGYVLGVASLGAGFATLALRSGALHDRLARTRVTVQAR